MFQPDLFSSPRPLWTPVQDAAAERISFLAEEAYPLLGQIQECPEQIGALEINSSNFRLHGADGRDWVLKRWKPTREIAGLQSTCALMKWLEGQGIAVAGPVETRGGELFVTSDDGYWGLFPYIEGDYFEGGDGQLDAAGEGIGDLFSALDRVSPGIALNDGPVHGSEADRRTLEIAMACRLDWARTLGNSHAVMLEGFADRIEMIFRQIVARQLAEGPMQASHYDLHPHNLLMSGDRLTAILDFDACQRQAAGYGIAFSTLKLVRQSAASGKDHREPKDQAGRFTRCVAGRFANLEKSREDLRYLAQSEVLRRICIILRLNFERNNHDWNHVLGVQLGHLDEIEAMFPL